MNESTTKRVARNFSWLLIGNGLNGLLVLATTVYIARVLGAASYGLYQFAQAFLVYLVLLIDGGLFLFGIREIACDKPAANKIAFNLFAIRIITAAVLFTLAGILLFLLPLDQQLRWLFIATFLFVFYRALGCEWVFQGLERMEYIPVFKLTIAVLTFLLMLWLVRAPQDLIKFPLIQAVCGVGVALVFAVLVFRRVLPATAKMLEPGTWPKIFWRALPLGASIFLIQIYNNLDVIMLGFMDQQTVVGYYSAAYKVYYACLGLFVIWQQTALPVMSERIATDLSSARVFINKYARLTALVFAPLTLITFLLAPVVISLVFGPAYLPAVGALRVLVWQLLSITIGSLFSILILIPAGRNKEFMFAVGIGALVNIVFNLLLIPRFSMIGAAYATILAEVAAMFTAVYFARQIIGLKLLRQYLVPGALAILALLGYWLSWQVSLPFDFLGRQLAAGFSYLVLYGILVFTSERKFIAGFIREIIR